jgi:hypothetical protein
MSRDYGQRDEELTSWQITQHELLMASGAVAVLRNVIKRGLDSSVCWQLVEPDTLYIPATLASELPNERLVCLASIPLQTPKDFAQWPRSKSFQCVGAITDNNFRPYVRYRSGQPYSAALQLFHAVDELRQSAMTSLSIPMLNYLGIDVAEVHGE